MFRLHLDTVMARPEIKNLVATIFAGRRDRAVNPEGEFDDGGRWYPDTSEKQLGSFSGIRGPSRAWPYSYMLRARTREHCRLLVRAWLLGRVTLRQLPADVAAAIRSQARPIGTAIRAAKKAFARKITQAGSCPALAWGQAGGRAALADRLEQNGATDLADLFRRSLPAELLAEVAQ